MESNLNPQVQAALNLEGYLEKSKPESLITYYQKRYCKILKDGYYMAYAGKPEDMNKGDFKGKISIREMLDSYVDESNPKRFELLVEGRAYKFEAKTPDECRKWVNSLKLIQDFLNEEDARWARELRRINPDFAIEEVEDIHEDKKELFLLQPIHLLTNNVKKVVLEGAVGTAVGIVKKSVKGVGDLLTSGKIGSNQDFLKAKGLADILDSIDPKVLKSRIKMGLVVREIKEATGLGVVDEIMNDTGMRDLTCRHWCFLISSKPLIARDVDPHDETTLGKGSLPLDIDYDTLYMYDDTCDDSKPVDVFQMKEVEHVVVKKRSHKEGIFRFVLDMGERKLTLICNTFEEMDTWLHSIQTSRTTCTEYHNSTLPILKNLFWIIKIKDGQDGENKLRDKIEADYEKLTQTSITDITSLILVQQNVASEFIAVINAALACRNPRIDIIKAYEEVYHQNVVAALKNYYKKKAQELENKDLFETIKFLHWYENALIAHSPSLSDPRLKEGISILSTMAATRILQRPNMKAISNILGSMIKEQPDIDGRGRFTTQVPKDVFKVLNETLNIISFCNVDEFTLKLLETCHQTLEYFQNGEEALIDQADFSNEQLAGLANDVMLFISEIKEFVSLSQKLVSDTFDIGAYFNDRALTRRFVLIGKKALQKLSDNLVTTQTERFKKGFLQFDLPTFLDEVLNQTEELTNKMHPSYPSKVGAEILKHVVSFYVKLFLTSAEKKTFKKEDLPALKKRTLEAQDIITENFKIFKDLRAPDLEKAISPITDIYDFFTTSCEQLTLTIQTMKDLGGNQMKWGTLEHLIKLKAEEIAKESRGEIVNLCKEVFNTAEKSRESESNRSSLIDNDSTDSMNSFDRTNSMMSAEGSSKKNFFRSGTQGTVTMRTKLEGYLENESNVLEGVANILAGHSTTNFFTIRKEKMFCFKDNTSENALMTLDLKDTVEVKPHHENKKKFILKIRHDGVKDYNFIAENEHKRDLWIKTIQNVMTVLSIRESKPKIEIEEEIYKDALPLFTNSETAPSLKYEYKGPKPAQKSPLSEAFVLGEKIQEAPPSSSSFVAKSETTKSTIYSSPNKYDDDEPEMPKPGFCALLCMKLGFVKPKMARHDSYFRNDERL